MNYERIFKGHFIDRPNRFIAHIEINGNIETVHVKNTGRCKELLIKDAEVYVQRSNNPNRKTNWDLISVKKGERIINMDSQIPNDLVEEWIREGNLFADFIKLKREVTFKNSRFDLFIETKERKIFVEVKGVTLENANVVSFPDAPSIRAVKHINELIKAVKNGYEAYIFFVIQMKDVLYFRPNIETHEEFALALKEAKEKGVNILAYDCNVTENTIKINKAVNVNL